MRTPLCEVKQYLHVTRNLTNMNDDYKGALTNRVIDIQTLNQ